MLRLVQPGGRWASTLCVDCVAFLPKGSTAEPGDQRPIVLLPRRAAYGRRCGTSSSRSVNAPVGCCARGGAEALAGALALVGEAAHAGEGSPLAGLAADCSKCDDRLPRDAVGARRVHSSSGLRAQSGLVRLSLAPPLLQAASWPSRSASRPVAWRPGALRFPTGSGHRKGVAHRKLMHEPLELWGDGHWWGWMVCSARRA